MPFHCYAFGILRLCVVVAKIIYANGDIYIRSEELPLKCQNRNVCLEKLFLKPKQEKLGMKNVQLNQITQVKDYIKGG